MRNQKHNKFSSLALYTKECCQDLTRGASEARSLALPRWEC
jgi:hypothetical protein